MLSRVSHQLIYPGVYELRDRMGMHMALITGGHSALLWDTGYGFDDLPKAIRELTALPVTVINSHGHHDHACGNDLFDEVLIDKKDIPVCLKYAGGWRGRVWAQAQGNGIPLDDLNETDFLSRGPGNLHELHKTHFDLGGQEAEVIALPGHTPGSIGLYIKRYRLVLPGDTFNPTTWVFFDECESFEIYYASLRKLSALDFTHLLCPHDAGLIPRARFDAFFAGLTVQTLANAKRENGLALNKPVFSCHPSEDTTFVFDASKLPEGFARPQGHD